MLNLDTHVLIKAVDADLTAHERAVLTADPNWGVSPIVPELEKLYETRPAPAWVG